MLVCLGHSIYTYFFFFNDTAPPEIYTLSLHDALPISRRDQADAGRGDERPDGAHVRAVPGRAGQPRHLGDRKSTRLNSSHANISYAVFCLKKKKINKVKKHNM